MQALILAGGEGTRLRPLTSTIPKPVVPLVDRPFITFMLEWLRGHGVDDVVLSTGHMASGVRNVLGDGSGLGIRLRYVEEQEPLGTGGAVKLAESFLDERFLVLNGDVLTDFDLSAQLAAHESTGARGTLALIAVSDPSAYGLVRLEDDGAVRDFLEKPAPDQIDTHLVSAGAYVLERSVLELMPPDTNVSIEREIFPRLIDDGLYGHAAQGYWLDIGTPQHYLRATFDILEGEVQTGVLDRLGGSFLHVAPDVENEGRVVPPALVGGRCRIRPGAHVGARAVLAPDVTVGEDSTVQGSVVLRGAEIGRNCVISDAIVGAGARVGDNCTIDGETVLGEAVTLGPDNHLTAGARLFPQVSLPEGAIRFS
jgi:mannose-1-phosphate guanylyltransferase